MVERGPFKSEVEGSIPSALTNSQISVLDTDAPFFTLPSSFVMLSAAKHDTTLPSVLPTFNEKR